MLSGMMGAQYAATVSPSGKTGGASATSMGGDGFSALLQMMLSISPVLAQSIGTPTAGSGTEVSDGTQVSGKTVSPLDALIAQLQAKGIDVGNMTASEFLTALKQDPDLMQSMLAQINTLSSQNQGDAVQSALAQLAAKGLANKSAITSSSKQTTEENPLIGQLLPQGTGTLDVSGLDETISLDDTTLNGILAQAEAVLKNVKEQGTVKQPEKTALTLSDLFTQDAVVPATAGSSVRMGAEKASLWSGETTDAIGGVKYSLGETTSQTFTFVPQSVLTTTAHTQNTGATAQIPSVTWNAYSPDDVKTFAAELGARITAGAQQVKITMKPEHLGDMTVSVKMDAASGMKLDVTVDSTQAKSLVEQNVAALKDAFGESGLKLTSLDVNVREQKTGQQNASQQTSDGQTNRNAKEQTDENPFARQQRERQERERDLHARLQSATANRGVNFWA
jgi:flagellar hook-length control protein FliK